MRTNKPRPGKAAKTAARTVRRTARGKPIPQRRKASPPKGKARKTRTTRTSRTPARKGTRLKSATRRIVRKPRARVALIPVAGELPPSPAVAGLKQESDDIPPERAEAAGTLVAGQLREKTTPSDSGLRIPPILLEGDEPGHPVTGPGQKFVLGATAPTDHVGPEDAGLPEAYGTGKLFLVAREPHWLYAHWDLTLEQQQRYNALSPDRHLVVRVCAGPPEAPPEKEVHVHPESRHWFIHVDHGEAQYVAELGYYRPGRKWVTIATSSGAVTPGDRPSAERWVRFETIPLGVRLAELASPAKQTIPAGFPPLGAARERALAELVSLHPPPEDLGSSAAAAELARRGGERGISAVQLAFPELLGGESVSVSSPMAAPEERPAGFWFNINAELVLYGGTEPDATVTIDGRPVELRPDGTFSCRLSLPDGDHLVTVSALSAQGELRQAELEFSRRTDYQGDVGEAPEDPSLQPPGGEYP